MRESGWYPPGAEHDPAAPYNQVDPEYDFDFDELDIVKDSITIFDQSKTISFDLLKHPEGFQLNSTVLYDGRIYRITECYHPDQDSYVKMREVTHDN